MSINIRPLHDRVIVQQAEDEQKTAGGIVIPDTAKEKPSRGDVLAVGPGRRLDSGEIQALEVEVGDKVLYGKYAGTEVKVDGKTVIVLREDDIIGVIKE
jgi:chaperonin GroES